MFHAKGPLLLNVKSHVQIAGAIRFFLLQFPNRLQLFQSLEGALRYVKSRLNRLQTRFLQEAQPADAKLHVERVEHPYFGCVARMPTLGITATATKRENLTNKHFN